MGVRYGKRSANAKPLSTWWMCPRLIPKYLRQGKSAADRAAVCGSRRQTAKTHVRLGSAAAHLSMPGGVSVKVSTTRSAAPAQTG